MRAIYSGMMVTEGSDREWPGDCKMMLKGGKVLDALLEGSLLNNQNIIVIHCRPNT